MSAAAIIVELVSDAIKAVRGNADDITAKNVAEAIADKVKESIAATIHVELEKAAAVLGLELAVIDLAYVTSQLLEKLRNEGPSMTDKLLDGVQIEQMPPGWKPEPEGSSER